MPTPIRALGEIALRVNDLEAMTAFYRDVVGLDVLQRFPDITFFRIAEGFAGHTQVLALFDRRTRDPEPPRAAASTVDHLAFTIPLSAYAAEKARLEALGLIVSTAEHAWVHWRSLYFRDPEGNQLELVCYDPSV
jgi:catechol-2,3-dioxygenase